MLADDAVFQCLVDRCELRLARHAHEVGIAGIAARNGLLGHLHAVRPFDFKRWQR
jgi:hypothetical protein